MPEGPEVRKYADALDKVLSGHVISSFEARTKDAREWLRHNEHRVVGNRVDRVMSHGKHLIGYISGGFFFHSHLMMWGRWQTFGPATSPKEIFVPPEKDRRERARIVVDGGAAILLSAPVFNIGEGNPYLKIVHLASLGPDVLPYEGVFDAPEFKRRLLLRRHLKFEIGAALLNQRIVAGLGNYLRAEILFSCKLNPWLTVGNLSERQLKCLIKTVPRLARSSYKRGATAANKYRERMATDDSLVYRTGKEYGTRHMVFRRTNLPCLRCGESVKQLRQKTYDPELADEGDERTRIIYFCPGCQRVKL